MSIFEPLRLRIGGESEEEQERRATWTELFYDLVFVVAISQLAHNLKGDISWSGIVKFVFLFIPVWWSWIGTTMYANRFDNDDIGRRLLVGLQMLTAAALAVNIHHGLDANSVGFALAYALGRMVLIWEYVRAGVQIPEARPLTIRYAVGFAIACLFWLVSVAVPSPWRFLLWGIGIGIDLVTPFTARQHHIKLAPHPLHLPERFGLFTLIVLGESIVGVVDGVSQKAWSVTSAIAAFCGLGIAFAIWWVYFDNLGGTPIQSSKSEGRSRKMMIWLYGHFPLVVGIAGVGVSVEKVLLSNQYQALPDNIRWLLGGATALCWFSMGVFHRLGLIRFCKLRTKYRIGGSIGSLAIAIFGHGLLPIIVIGLSLVIAILQVVQDLSTERSQTRSLEPEI